METDKQSKMRCAVNNMFNINNISAIIWEEVEDTEVCAVLLKPGVEIEFDQLCGVEYHKDIIVAICQFCSSGLMIHCQISLTGVVRYR